MFLRLILSLILSFFILVHAHAEDDNIDSSNSLESLISKLITKKFDEKEALIKQISETQHERSLLILKTLLEGKLYYKKDDKTIVIAEIVKKDANIIRAIDGEKLGETKKKKIKKIGINNKLRRALNTAIAKLSIGHNKKINRANGCICYGFWVKTCQCNILRVYFYEGLF